MNARKITVNDHTRINQLILKFSLNGQLSELEKKLKHSELIQSELTPSDLVTMNTEVLIEDHFTNQTYPVRLVYQLSPLYKNQVSVLAPLEMALLGTKETESISYSGRDHQIRGIVIKQILYQPEAAGHLDL